jgi:hypothetical protein
MRTVLALLLLIPASAGAGLAQVDTTGANYLQLLPEADSAASSAIAVEGAPGTYWFDPTPVLTLQAVRDAAVEQHGRVEGFVVCLHLTEAGLEALTRHRDRVAGHQVGVIIGGRLMAAPFTLTGGSPQVLFPPAGLSLPQAMQLVDDLNARIDRLPGG